jgi:hypothetical protein
MIEAGAPSTSSRNTPGSGVVPAPPGVDMVAPPATQRNASRTQSEDRARSGVKKSAAKGIIEAEITVI